MFNSGSQPDMASLHTSHSNASHIETLRKNGEAIADAVAAHMLIHTTDHHHEVIRKKGTFKVSEEEDCSRCIKEIVRKRYPNPLLYIEELGNCIRKLHILDRSSAGSGQVLRLSLSLQWNLPVTHENDLSEYTRTYARIVILARRTQLSQGCDDDKTEEWTISDGRSTADESTSSTRVIAPTCSGLSKRDLTSWRLEEVIGCSRFDLGRKGSVPHDRTLSLND
jgi:hypothetical protein